MVAALESEGLSGRTLRKLPFLAYAGSYLSHTEKCSTLQLAAAFKQAVLRENRERTLLNKHQKR